MDKQLLIYSCFILFGTFISAISQVLLKISAQRTYDTKISEYLNPLVVCAYIIFFIATLCSVYAYKVVPLSMGPVLEATSYIYVTLFGVFLFHEKITMRKWLSLFLIISGIVIYSVLG